jgi:hypothetical protein
MRCCRFPPTLHLYSAQHVAHAAGMVGPTVRIERHQGRPGGAELGDDAMVGAGPIAWD